MAARGEESISMAWLDSMVQKRDFDAILSSLRESGVFIYGAGKIGVGLVTTFLHYGIPIHALWDQQAASIQTLRDIPVTKLVWDEVSEAQKKNIPVIVTIFVESLAEAVCREFHQKGFTQVTSDRTFLDFIIECHCEDLVQTGQFKFLTGTCHLCPVQKNDDGGCKIFDEQVALQFAGIDLPAIEKQEDHLIISSIGVLISNKCNLTCLGCNHLRDHYKKGDNVDIDSDRIVADLKAFLGAVDFLKTLVLVGGEAFLHPNAEEIIQSVLELPKVGIVNLITNGTVLPKKDSFYQLLKNDRIFIEISGYGDQIDPRLTRRRKEFLANLKKFGINHRYMEFHQWTDFGSLKKRGYSPSKRANVYAECCFISNDMFDGKLFKCSRSVFGTFIGAIPDFPTDYVDVRTKEPMALRAKIKAFFANQSPLVCNYCNGVTEKTIVAGIQKKSQSQRSL